jgi:hypothetical protein
VTFAVIFMFSWGAAATGGLTYYWAKWKRVSDALAYIVEEEAVDDEGAPA